MSDMNKMELISSLLDQIQGWCNELAEHEHCDPIIRLIEADMKEVMVRTEDIIGSVFDISSGVELPPGVECSSCRVQLIDSVKGIEECRRSTMLEF